MKVVNLCGNKGCCPVVTVTDEFVEIGEARNLCKLKISEWKSLKEKVINNEI